MSWNKTDGTKAEKPTNKVKLGRWLATTGLTIAVLAGGAIYFLQKPEVKAKIKGEKGPAKIVEVEADLQTEQAEVPTSMPTKRIITKEEQKKLRPGDEGFDPAAHPTILIIPPKEGPEVKQPYRNTTEQTLLWIMNCEPGDAPLPLLDLPNSDMDRMAEILIDKVEDEEDDDEWTKEQRENLRFAKEEMRKYIKEGGEPEDFLKYYHDQLEAMHLERSMALDSVMSMLRDGVDDDIAEDYIKEVNKKLMGKGIKPIQLSKKKMERHGINECIEADKE